MTYSETDNYYTLGRDWLDSHLANFDSDLPIEGRLQLWRVWDYLWQQSARSVLRQVRTGYEAIQHAEQHAVLLKKYADPVEDYREDVTPEEARKIASEDPHLIFGDGSRYEVRLIGHEEPNGKIRLHELMVSFDDATDAKDFATAHSGDGYFGTAIVDIRARTVDLGDRTEGLDGVILE